MLELFHPFKGTVISLHILTSSCIKAVIARSKSDSTRAETRFGLSAKQTSPFKSAGVSVQSTAGSRGVRISGQQLYRPCSDVQCKTTGYPLHSHLSPSLPLPCVTVCHQVLDALYHFMSNNSQSKRAKNLNRRNIPFVEQTYDISRTTSSYVTDTDALKHADAKQFTCEHSTKYDSPEFRT